MIEIIPFEIHDSPSRTLYEVYDTVQVTRNRRKFNFLGYLIRDKSKWIAIENGMRAKKFATRKEALDFITGDAQKVTRAA